MKYYTIEDENFVPFGFFINQNERDEAYIKYIVKKNTWGIRGELTK